MSGLFSFKYGLGIARLLGFEADIALGVLMVACAPGGGISNTASYLVEGEVPLSISMSFFSTAIAAGMSSLFFYSKTFCRLRYLCLVNFLPFELKFGCLKSEVRLAPLKNIFSSQN